jgi:hypothetical protein
VSSHYNNHNRQAELPTRLAPPGPSPRAGGERCVGNDSSSKTAALGWTLTQEFGVENNVFLNFSGPDGKNVQVTLAYDPGSGALSVAVLDLN